MYIICIFAYMDQRINIDIPEKVLEAYENEAKKQRMSRKALIEKTVIDKAPKVKGEK